MVGQCALGAFSGHGRISTADDKRRCGVNAAQCSAKQSRPGERVPWVSGYLVQEGYALGTGLIRDVKPHPGDCANPPIEAATNRKGPIHI